MRLLAVLSTALVSCGGACSPADPGSADAATAPDAAESADAGGTPVTPGDFSGRYTDSHGRRGHYVGWVPEGLVHPGALVFLHADDGGDTYEEWISPATKALATTHGMLAISLQEPDDGCWWAPRTTDDTRYVGELVADLLLDERSVDPARIVLVGKSGGAFFGAGVPALLGFPWGGAVIGLCGGDIPRLNGGDCDTDGDAPVADVPLFSASAPVVRYWFATTTNDEYRRYSVDAAEAFRAAGAEVTFRNVGHGGHCEFDLVGELGTALATLDP